MFAIGEVGSRHGVRRLHPQRRCTISVVHSFSISAVEDCVKLGTDTVFESGLALIHEFVCLQFN